MKYSYIILVSLIICACGSEEDQPDVYVGPAGMALSGYDPVAYFTESTAKKGDEQYLVEFEDNLYAFSSEKNQTLFIEDPEKYVPAYGGWCAYAIAENSTKMAPDPELWQIQDGRLLLFYDSWTSSITGDLKEAWNEEPDQYLIKADKNWTGMKRE